MVSAINGNYNYSSRLEAIKPVNQTASTNESAAKKEDKPHQVNGCSNSLRQNLQANTMAKTENTEEDKVVASQSDNTQPNDISTLISLIESSRNMGVNSESPQQVLDQVLPVVPETESQLMIQEDSTLDPRKDAVLGELIDNFSKIDKNGSDVITHDEALAFINQQA